MKAWCHPSRVSTGSYKVSKKCKRIKSSEFKASKVLDMWSLLGLTHIEVGFKYVNVHLTLLLLCFKNTFKSLGAM